MASVCSWTAALAIVILSLFSTSLRGAPDREGSGAYAVTNTLHVGGEGRWDCVVVDARTQMLYVPRQSHTQILKAATGDMVADLKNTPGVHGVALVPEVNRGFITNGLGNTVTVFDLKTNQVLGDIAAGKKPDTIIYDSSSKKVLAFNGKSDDVTVIDAATDLKAPATKRIALDGAPEFAATDGMGHVYVNLEDKSSVAVLDVSALKVSAVWKIEGGEEPTGIAIDGVNHRLYCGCRNQVMAVLDTETGKTLATIPIGKGVDGCAFDAGSGEAFASCGDGTLTVAKETSPGKFEVIQVVQTRQGARTMALDPRSHTIYLPTAEFPKTPPPAGTRPAPIKDTFMIVVVTKTAK